jgi:pyridoxine kinase
VTATVKKVLAVHDISCYGRCSMQVIFPALSHYGLQVCPLPTALLSTHTGGFEGYTFLDLTDEMNKITAHWRTLGLTFDAIYTGFLGSAEQIGTVSAAIRDFSEKGTLILIDPVMGDNGSMYRTYTAEMCAGMKELCSHADILTPNLTEAYILTGREYRRDPDDGEVALLLNELSAMSGKSKKLVILHGVRRGDSILTFYSDTLTSDFSEGAAASPYCAKFYPGCGDLFSSMLLGMIMSGRSAAYATRKAADFISRAAFYTSSLGTPYTDGLAFEEMLTDYYD